MILSDREIDAALEHRFIRIDPVPDRQLWSATAIDLTLHGTLLEWIAQGASGSRFRVRPHRGHFDLKALLNDPSRGRKFPIDPQEGHLLQPQQFVLGFTREVVYLPHRSRLAARVEGKSSLARLGVGVHVTAPTIHAGFGFREGVPEAECGAPIQLEIFNVGPFDVVLDVGMPICQLILEEVREVPNMGYRGRFGDQTAFVAPPPEAPAAPKRRRRK